MNIPRNLLVGEGLTITKLNRYVRDNTNYLFSRPMRVVTSRNLSNLIVTSPTPVPIDDSLYALKITMVGNEAKIWIKGLFMTDNATTTQGAAFDFLIDNFFYASSMNSSPHTRGLTFVLGKTTANYEQSFYCETIVQNLSPGIHTFKPRWFRLIGSTATLIRSGALFQVGVMEI